MALKIINTDFELISHEPSIRSDSRFLDFQNNNNKENSYSFNELFELKQFSKIEYHEITGVFKYSEIGDVTKQGDVYENLINLDDYNTSQADLVRKILKGDIINVEKGDILISKIRPNLKKIVYINDSLCDNYFTKAFVKITPRKLGKVLYYCFSSVFFDNLVTFSRQGKGYPTLKDKDLLLLKFNKKFINNLISFEKDILRQVEPIEESIKQYKVSIKPQSEIINEIFAREFGFDMKRFYGLCNIKKYELDFSCFGENIDLRKSVKFHRNAGKFVIEELTKISKSKIKNFISEPIVLGTSVSPSDYDENGEFYYVSMANIKNWKFESDGAKLVGDNYSSLISKKLKVGDILLARSGEGTIGKVALIDEDVQGVFADFTMRIRLKNYNAQFAYYYFRTVYFQYLVEINKKGLGNNTNIFPSQLQELPIIDITLDRQQEIVDEIKKEIDSQNVYLEKIEVARKQIEEIIEKAISV